MQGTAETPLSRGGAWVVATMLQVQAARPGLCHGVNNLTVGTMSGEYKAVGRGWG